LTFTKDRSSTTATEDILRKCKGEKESYNSKDLGSLYEIPKKNGAERYYICAGRPGSSEAKKVANIIQALRRNPVERANEA